jgi:pyruvate/2-oxoglutarate dehydrogenase complex dihydrolipoamide acyltransferase (E2) component
MTLTRRIFLEKRAIVVPILVALVANVAAYVLVVRPLEQKSAGAADRAATASVNRRAAEREMALADALVTGKGQAERELVTFYDKVLPASQSAARRMTYAALPALASKANVRYREGRYDVELDRNKDERLGRLRIRMVLEGEYERVRRFIYALETSPEFVIIDDVTLAQDEANKPLLLTLDLSTYYRLESNGN